MSPVHPVGRHKCTFFALLGYNVDDWSQLETDLRNQHLMADAEIGDATSYGQKYEIQAPLQGPNGRQATVMSVWIVRNGEVSPRFVSAMPA